MSTKTLAEIKNLLEPLKPVLKEKFRKTFDMCLIGALGFCLLFQVHQKFGAPSRTLTLRRLQHRGVNLPFFFKMLLQV
jgi:hypothetical protein